MSELSNAAMLLIKRMEEYPDDFSYGKRFGYFIDSLEALVGLSTTNQYGGIGRLAYLDDADKAALAEAWRKLKYSALEKEIMTVIFKSDAEFEEEKKQFAYPLGISQQQMTTISSLQNASQVYQPGAQNSIGSSHTGTGLLSSAGSNAGLLGGLTGLFK
jgi:hypothetical protein